MNGHHNSPQTTPRALAWGWTVWECVQKLYPAIFLKSYLISLKPDYTHKVMLYEKSFLLFLFWDSWEVVICISEIFQPLYFTCL